MHTPESTGKWRAIVRHVDMGRLLRATVPTGLRGPALGVRSSPHLQRHPGRVYRTGR
ncbi:hypothetical protein DPMN_095185 [Dreissena polymorpha]|uniref:Uncharacterized protein n=1 Tax=Dreissena polymorpha TaxID=45954 RepID=A0A9D4L8V5_DREPO|nr:hypothetical protein DPMN_095185 [Dreissena polymorpha]